MKRKSDYEKRKQQAPDVELENDERILYHESRDDEALSVPNLILGFLLILGFPFYGMILIFGIGGLISGAQLDEILPMIREPAFCLGAETIVISAVVLMAKEKIRAMIPTTNHLIITNKRIFSAASNLFFSKDLPVVVQESRFSEVALLETEQKKKHGLLKVKVKKANPSEDESREQIHWYQSANASLAYSFIPCEITLTKGPKSAAGNKEKNKSRVDSIVSCVLMGFVLCLMIAYGSWIVLQESARRSLVSSRDAFIRKDYKQAEDFAQMAYDRISKLPFHTYYGPACYRLAIAYVANHKPDAAIPLFKHAAEHCGKEEDMDWSAAIFRSHAQLARIFQSRGDVDQAKQFYKQALAEVGFEYEKERIESFCNQYADFLKSHGRESEIDFVRAIALKAVERPHTHAFKE